MSDVYYGFFQQYERMSYIAVSMSIKGVSSIAGTLVLYCPYEKCVVRESRTCADLANGIVGLRHAPRTASGKIITRGAYRQLLALRYNFPLLWQIIWLALPLGLGDDAGVSSGNIPRYFLDHYQGKYAVGIFSALYSLLVAGATVTGALGQAATPRLARLHADGHYRAFYHLLNRLLLTGVLLGAAGLLVAVGGGHFLLHHLFKQEYARYLHEFTLVMLAAGIQYLGSSVGYALTAARILQVNCL